MPGMIAMVVAVGKLWWGSVCGVVTGVTPRQSGCFRIDSTNSVKRHDLGLVKGSMLSNHCLTPARSSSECAP